jgi:hypothetical protein
MAVLAIQNCLSKRLGLQCTYTLDQNSFPDHWSAITSLILFNKTGVKRDIIHWQMKFKWRQMPRIKVQAHILSVICTLIYLHKYQGCSLFNHGLNLTYIGIYWIWPGVLSIKSLFQLYQLKKHQSSSAQALSKIWITHLVGLQCNNIYSCIIFIPYCSIVMANNQITIVLL